MKPMSDEKFQKNVDRTRILMFKRTEKLYALEKKYKKKQKKILEASSKKIGRMWR